MAASRMCSRLWSSSGFSPPPDPTPAMCCRPFDRQQPKRIAFLQCVGSRDSDRDYCSSVCCMYATKEAIIAKEHLGEGLQCDVFFMDMRAFSKGFEQYYRRAQELGVRYIRSRVPKIEEVAGTRNLIVQYLGENDSKLSQEYDLVVLSVGMQPPKEVKVLAERFGVALNKFNFCGTSTFRPAESSREGIFVAGPFAEPKDIPETVMQASAAASQVLSLLREARGTLITPKVYPPERDVKGEEPRIGVFVCHCGTNIAGVVNVPDVVEYAKTLPNVVYAENNLYTCSNDTQDRIKEKIAEHNLNRVVVASCTPRTHEPLFRNTLAEAGLNPYLFEMANIRDQCSWVHMHEPEKATQKSKDLVRMALAKARLLEPLHRQTVRIEKSALVIGGGVSGMTAALDAGTPGLRCLSGGKGERAWRKSAPHPLLAQRRQATGRISAPARRDRTEQQNPSIYRRSHREDRRYHRQLQDDDHGPRQDHRSHARGRNRGHGCEAVSTQENTCMDRTTESSRSVNSKHASLPGMASWRRRAIGPQRPS